MLRIIISLRHFKPVRFYPYPHTVTNRIVENNRHEKGYQQSNDLLYKIWLDVVNQAKNIDTINYREDNKTVIEMVNADGQSVFIGYKDGNVAIGLGFKELL